MVDNLLLEGILLHCQLLQPLVQLLFGVTTPTFAAVIGYFGFQL